MGTTNFDTVAADFVGNLTGNVTGNVTGTVTTTGVANSGTFTGPPSVIAAAGATQGTATLIGAFLNVIVTATASTEGVKLPVATAGREIRIFSKGTVGALVYPNTGGQIESSSTNSAVLIAAGKGNLYVAENTKRWFVVKGN